MTTSHTPSHLSLYQSDRLSAYSKRLIYGFTGKPASLGGPDTPSNPRADVTANRQRLWQSLETVPEGDWIIPHQVHGHRIGRTGDADFQQTDGIVLVRPGQPAMLLFADCVPVLLYDPVCHAGAVLHAGWRGTAQNIAKEGVVALQNTVGSAPSDLVAVIGPAISQCCFQVSRAVAEALADAHAMTLETLEQQGLLVWDAAFPDNPRVDLKGLNRYQLALAGVTQIDILPDCTHCQPEVLFSYRRKEDGRNSAFMMLK